jgi:hypothetical protein
MYKYSSYPSPSYTYISSAGRTTGANIQGPDKWVHDDIRWMKPFDNAGEDLIFAGCDGGVVKGSYTGACGGNYFCWYNISDDGTDGLHTAEFYGIAGTQGDPGLLLGGTQDMSVFVYDKSAANIWKHASSGDGGKGTAIDFTNNSIMYQIDYFNGTSPSGSKYKGRILKSENRGNSFSNQFYNYFSAHGNTPLEFHPTNSSILYVGERYELSRFTNLPTDWSREIINPPGNEKFIMAVEIARSNPNVVYTANNKYYYGNDSFSGCIWRTENANLSIPVWTDISAGLTDATEGGGLNYGFVTDIESNPYDEYEIWVTFALAKGGPKVFHSTDGGDTWEKYAEGIPESIPINEILYDEHNEILYAATDIGVWYRERSGIQWQAFNSGLPFKIVTDLEINYCASKLRASTYGRGIWESDIIQIDKEISGTETWSSPKIQSSNLRLLAGSQLTITDEVSFTKNTKLVVEPGAKLIIDGGVLKNSCGNTWKGILVMGNSGLPQWNTANQGYLEILNNGVIENAEVGISVGTDRSRNQAGGIVKINGAVFRDNIIGIKFYEYQNYAFIPEIVTPNASYIYNCTFETTNNLYDIDLAPEEFIYLIGVDGVSTYNCTFNNNAHNLYPYQFLGKGVKMISANCSVTESEFNNLRYGIFVQGTSDFSALTLKENIFTDNVTGIYAEAAGDYKIYYNDFYVNDIAQGEYEYGIEAYYNNETFLIEENNFYGDNPLNSVIGINAINNNSNQNLYKNKFYDVHYGIRLSNNPLLQVECNEFEFSGYGPFYGVHLEPDGAYWAIGQIDYPAGNKFNGYFTYQLIAQNDYYTYYYDPLNPNHPNPYLVTNNIALQTILAGSNECLSHFSGGGGGGGSIDDLTSKDDEINNTKSLLETVTDGGDTDGLNQTVDDAEPDEALKLRNELLSESPNLSDTVMINATNVEDVLPSVMLTQVLSENPQAAKSNNVQNALDNRINQLPVYMRDAINQGRFSSSLKENIENNIIKLQTQRERIYTNLLDVYSNDTTQTGYDNLQNLLQNETDLKGKYRLISYYLSRKDRVNAENIFNSIPQDFELTLEEENEYNAMAELNSVLFNLIDEEKSLYETDSIQFELIRTLSEDTITIAGAYARGIMTMIDTVDHISVFPFPDVNGDKGNNPEPIVYPETFKVFPNPANDYFIIEYALSDKETVKDVSLSLYDNKGKEVMGFEVDTRANQILAECDHLTPGVYWCRKFNKGVVANEERVVIIGNSGIIDFDENNINGFEEILEGDKITIYPNPANDFFNISINNSLVSDDLLIRITDTQGKVFKETSIESFTNQFSISCSTWTKGVYMVSLISNNEILETLNIVIK